MSDQDDTDEGSDWYERLCNLPPCTEEEFAAINKEFAGEIRQMGLPRTITRNGKTIVLEPVYVEPPWTDLPDEATMDRMITESIKEGWLPFWTHWTPAVRHRPYNGKPSSPKPLIFDGLFLGYVFANGTVIRS